MKTMKIASLWAGLLLSATAAFPQVFEVSLHGGVSNLSNSRLGTLDTTSAIGLPTSVNLSLQDGFRIGFRTTLNSYRFAGHEFGYAYNRTQLRYEYATPVEQGMAIHQGFYNFLLYATREGSRVRPFAAGGAHFNNYVPPGSSATYGGGSTKFGFNYGAGVKVRIGDKWAIRLDARQYQNGHPFDLPGSPSGLLRQNEFSIGFGLVL